MDQLRAQSRSTAKINRCKRECDGASQTQGCGRSLSVPFPRGELTEMTSSDANPAAPAAIQHGRAPACWARVERAWWVVLVGAMVVFSAFPIANQFLGLSTKDYGLWYHVGLAVRQGLDIYPRPETGRLFPFMYPPSAATMLAWLSFFGSSGSLLVMVIVNSLSWLVCILLSVWLATGSIERRHPFVVIVPSLSTVVLVYNIYLLGQPNLLLLALLLGTFACLRLRREFIAGALWRPPRRSRPFR